MKIRLENIGKAGDADLHLPDKPGVYALQGPNGEGKTTSLDALTQFFGPDQAARLPGSYITRGKLVAKIDTGVAGVTITGDPSGETYVSREGSEEQIFEPAGNLLYNFINGAGNGRTAVKDKDARERNRLAALLKIRPIDATPERVDALVAAIGTPPEAPQGMFARWDALQASAAARIKNYKPLRLVSLESARSAAGKAAKSVLGAQEGLYEMIKAARNAASKSCEEQEKLIARAEEACESVAREAAERFGSAEGIGEWSTSSREGHIEHCRNRAATLRADRQRGIKEVERLESLKTELEKSGRPEVDEEPLARSAAKLKEAEEAFARAEAKAEATREATREAVARLKIFESREDDAKGAFSSAYKAENFLDMRKALDAWEERHKAVSESYEMRLESDKKESEARAALGSADAALAMARGEHGDEQRRLEDAKKSQGNYDRAMAEAAQGVMIPSAEEVAEAEKDVADHLEAEEKGRVSERWREADQKVEIENEILKFCEEVRDFWTDAGPKSWEALGDIVTEELSLPWLRCSRMKLIVRYNANDRLCEEGDKVAREQDVDDENDTSTAQCYEALLGLYIKERSSRGDMPVLVFTWTRAQAALLSAFTPKRAADWLVPLCVECGVRLLFERPSDGPFEIVAV